MNPEEKPKYESSRSTKAKFFVVGEENCTSKSGFYNARNLLQGSLRQTSKLRSEDRGDKPTDRSLQNSHHG
jgi:hypothetical protein